MSARDGEEAVAQEDTEAAANAQATGDAPKLTTERRFSEALERSGVAQLLMRHWRLTAIVGWLLLTAVSGIQGPGFVLLMLIAGALVLSISLFWGSIRTVIGETGLSGADAYALAAPRAEEEQKQAVLRALKDLEFERSVGKISDDDYAELVAKYRSEAKRLLRALEDDARPRRERVESLVREHLIAAGLEKIPMPEASALQTVPAEPRAKKKSKKSKNAARPAATPDAEPARTVEIEPLDASDAPAKAKVNVDATWKSEGTAKTKESPAYVPPTKTCSECSTRNDPDAIFCKKCGSKSFTATGSIKPPAKTEADPSEEKAAEDEAASDEAQTDRAEEAR